MSELRRGRKPKAEACRHVSEGLRRAFAEGRIKRGKTVICVETGKRFGSRKEAASEFGIDASSITRAISDNRLVGFKYHFVNG